MRSVASRLPPDTGPIRSGGKRHSTESQHTERRDKKPAQLYWKTQACDGTQRRNGTDRRLPGNPGPRCL